jgi:hypothetical protein
MKRVFLCVCFLVFFLVVLGFELRLKSYTSSHSASSFFVMDFCFKRRSHKLFAGWVGFQPQSS